jgi:hypothetical protein
MPFYGPDPPPQARAAFNEYVKCRWPIHIFALDPVTQEENLGDVFSRRRETQLALSLAFASGRMTAGSFTRFARRLETDMSTIALHRTAVGFSHGENTFGWRFYPRFQTPPIESNLTVIFRDQLWGGPNKDHETCKHQIEPGMRECVALVIMPSFVPYITIDSRSNWFRLTNPKRSEFDLTDVMRLSESVKRMEMCVARLKDSHCYRDGDVGRLLSRVKQLSEELPLQTLVQQVPMENTLGGFAMLSSGQTELAPVLTGFYGEPGVQPGRPSTVYLIGDNFSEHETTVIAGNRPCEYKMLSRRVLQVHIPADVQFNKEKGKAGDEYHVDVHVATAYGASGHLSIPLDGDATTVLSYRWAAPTVYTVTYQVDAKNNVIINGNVLSPSSEVVIDAPPGLPVPKTSFLKLVLRDDVSHVGAKDGLKIRFEYQTNRFILSGEDFGTANEALRLAVAGYIARNLDRAPTLLTLSGTLYLNDATFVDVESFVTIHQRKEQ